MKKILIMLYLVSFPISVLCQDLEATQSIFNFYGCNNCYLSSSYSWFKQDSFLLGWHWGFGRKMSEAMLDNQAHVASGYQKSWIKNNKNLIINTNNVWDNGGFANTLNAQSIFIISESVVIFERVTLNSEIRNMNQIIIYNLTEVRNEKFIVNNCINACYVAGNSGTAGAAKR